MLNFKGKLTAGLLLAGAVVSMGMLAAPATAQASSKYLTGQYGSYVRAKRDVYVGISQRHGHTYKPLLKKKGSLLFVTSSTQKFGSSVVKSSFTSGAVHYNRLKNLAFTMTDSVPLTKANFKKVTLKAPIRGTILRQGNGFKDTKKNGFASPMFYLTLDNYIQYYNQAAMNKYDNGGVMSVNYGNSMEVYKPTASAKMTKTTVKGNTTTVQYNKYIKGLPGKKISAHTYQIKITDLKTKGSKSFEDDYYGGTWNNYTVNGKPYFSGIINDFG
ncbi:hypothetical protein [Levilactobacillus parabrevis]|uniref:hypothetical protein n=1 Tax=Levilactobacillus parabrevis TaxID=357278 RepID=UPI0037563E8A